MTKPAKPIDKPPVPPTPAMRKEAILLADDFYTHQIFSYGYPVPPARNGRHRGGLLGHDGSQVKRIEDACFELADAYEWLSQRNLVELGRNRYGVYLELCLDRRGLGERDSLSEARL